MTACVEVLSEAARFLGAEGQGAFIRKNAAEFVSFRVMVHRLLDIQGGFVTVPQFGLERVVVTFNA
jgi:hypothetical protein